MAWVNLLEKNTAKSLASLGKYLQIYYSYLRNFIFKDFMWQKLARNCGNIAFLGFKGS